MLRRRVLFSIAAALLAASASTASGEDAPPRLRLGFQGPCGQALGLQPGESQEIAVDIVLEAADESSSLEGVSAWSFVLEWDLYRLSSPVAVTTRGTVAASVLDDPPGLRTDGFEETMIDDTGWLIKVRSSVVLSQDHSVTLPAGSATVIAHMTVKATCSGMADAPTALSPVRLSLSETEPSLVTWRGTTLDPQLGVCAFESCSRPEPCLPPSDAQVQFIFQKKNIVVSPEPFAGLAGPADMALPALIVAPGPSASAHLGIVSRLGVAESGASAWSVAVEARGDIAIIEVTTDETAVESVAPGAFVKSDLTMQHGGAGRARAASSTCVLSLNEPVTLPPVGTATILSIRLAPDGGVGGELLVRDGVFAHIYEVFNEVRVGQENLRVGCARRLGVLFDSTRGDFIRCNANAGGLFDISDIIFILSELFLNGPPYPCPAAADCNFDGRTDISDPIYGLGHLFLGKPAPPAPFPECGGAELLSSAEQCPRGSTPCP